MARILIIDDEEPIRFSLRGILEDEGYEVLEAATAEEGLEVADAERPDLVFLDIWLPGMDGLTAQARLKGNHPDLPVVMISGHGTIETAVSAIQQGAYDFIEKPLSLEKVVIVAARALEAGSLRRENQVLRTVLPEQDELHRPVPGHAQIPGTAGPRRPPRTCGYCSPGKTARARNSPPAPCTPGAGAPMRP